jgi:pimeloyl-ACP methyl ester carboxylesterase
MRIFLLTILVSCAPTPETARSRDAKASEREASEESSESSNGTKRSTRDEDTATQEPSKRSISFTGSRGDKVPGYLWTPGGNKTYPSVLLMYGINDNKDSGTIAAVAERLSKEGFVSMTIDWPGTGDRGSISNQDRIVNPEVKNWTVADYGTALAFLKTQPEVDDERIAYIGASMGAMTGLAFAAKEPQIKSFVAVVPIPNPLWGTDDPIQTIRRVSPRPMLCISTADGSDFSTVVCQNVGAGGESKALPGGHELEGMREKVADLAVEFLKRTLK